MTYQDQLKQSARERHMRLWGDSPPVRMAPMPPVKIKPVKKPTRNEIARKVILSKIERKDVKNMFLHDILKAVSKVCDIPAEMIISPWRNTDVRNARHLYFYLAREFTLRSRYSVGKAAGYKHPSSVLHGERKIERDKPAWQDRIDAVKRELKIVV